MPLEALRYDITPTGLHYLLVHFDIPAVDADDAGGCALDGLVERPLELSLDDLRARPRRTIPVTLECAGNGRARLQPAAAQQPVAVRGDRHGRVDRHAARRRCSRRPALRADAAELVFTGADRGIQGGVEQDYQRSLSIAEATPAGGAARRRDERRSRSSRSTASRSACSCPAGTA